MNEHYPFVNPPLPYPYDALEPYIDEKTMMLHHDRHLQTYIDNLNSTLKNYPQYQSLSLEQLLFHIDCLPKEIQESVKNNAGGVFNHLLYFSTLNHIDQPDQLLGNILNTFGSFEEFEKQFTSAALSVFGSGYAWLVYDPYGNLTIFTTKNQDTPIPFGFYPVLNLDVWEHAYYLKHYNKRADYIHDWFSLLKKNIDIS